MKRQTLSEQSTVKINGLKPAAGSPTRVADEQSLKKL